MFSAGADRYPRYLPLAPGLGSGRAPAENAIKTAGAPEARTPSRKLYLHLRITIYSGEPLSAPPLLLTTAVGTVIPLPEWAMEPWIHYNGAIDN